MEFHDTACSCAYCELAREESASEARKLLAWAGAITAAILIGLAWLAQ